MDYTPPLPKRTVQQTDAILSAPGSCANSLSLPVHSNRLTRLSARSPFEWEVKRVGTRTVRVYKNLPPSIRDYWLQAASVRFSSLLSPSDPAHNTLTTRAQPFADKEYIVYEQERLTYADAHRRVLHLASLLHARGVRKGDRVAIAMRNIPEWIISCVPFRSSRLTNLEG